MTLHDILRVKGTKVHTIAPDATLDDVVQALVRHNCGSLLVCEPAEGGGSSRIVGIITERDILRTCAAHEGSLGELTVADRMTRRLITASPSDQVSDVMGLMTEKRIRHLPVLDGGELAGLISIGDIVKAQYDEMAFENYYLKSYIQS